MPVLNIDDFKRHGGSAVKGVFNPAGRAETAVASERRKFEIAADRAAKHSPAKGGITAVNHFVDVFNHGLAGM